MYIHHAQGANVSARQLIPAAVLRKSIVAVLPERLNKNSLGPWLASSRSPLETEGIRVRSTGTVFHQTIIELLATRGPMAPDLPLTLFLERSDRVSTYTLVRRSPTLVDLIFSLVLGMLDTFSVLKTVFLALRSSIVGINFDFHSLKGHHKPLRLAFRAAKMQGANISLLDGVCIERLPPWLQHQIIYAPQRIILNGLHCFEYDITFEIVDRRNCDTVAYLLEGRYQFKSFLERNPQRAQKAIAALQHIHVLAVSNIQAEQLREFGIEPAGVVFICAAVSPLRRPSQEKGRPLVAMVGTAQPRKGLLLFDECAKRAPDLDFVWVGGGPDPQFAKATFLGPYAPYDVACLLGRCDVLLLTSIDEPFSLVAAEALAAGCRVVCSTNVGTAELISGLQGCSTFEPYDCDAALVAMRKSLAEPLDPSAVADRLTSFTPESLWNRFTLHL